jgi:DNA-binding SARP family transcriptional activator
LLHRAIDRAIESTYCQQLLHERGLDLRAATTMTIRCLGCFEVVINSELIPVTRWQEQAAGALRMQRMLLYLARNRDPQPITTIARYVWPDSWDRIDVSSNFHLTLTGLRRVLEPDLEPGSASQFIATISRTYQLLATVHVTTDLDLFLHSVQNAQRVAVKDDRETARATFERAEELYIGDFALAKPNPGEADEYHRMLLEALRWVADDDLRRGSYDSCIRRTQRLLREDPWSREAPELLVEAYLDCGNRRAARRVYQRYLQLHKEISERIAQLAREHRL